MIREDGDSEAGLAARAHVWLRDLFELRLIQVPHFAFEGPHCQKFETQPTTLRLGSNNAPLFPVP